MTGFNPYLSLVMLLLGAAITVAVAGGVVIAILAAGDVGETTGNCRNRELSSESAVRDSVNDPALATQWQERWDQLNATLDSGQPTSVTFGESDATSRATQWAEETDAPLSDLTICFYDGIAEAHGRMEIPTLNDLPLAGSVFDTEVRIVGRIELGGEHPRIRISEIDAGDFPDWASEPLQDEIEEIVNDRLADYDIKHKYTVTFREGEMEVAGQP